MSAIQKMIDSRFRPQLAVCILSLCLATAASNFVDPPEIPLPFPPPLCHKSMGMGRTA